MLEHIKSSRSAALESNQQEQERIVSRKDNGKDMWQQSLRPKFFRDYIGQESIGPCIALWSAGVGKNYNG